jgi:glycosyltransferase involved in cell wall biosynthesis
MSQAGVTRDQVVFIGSLRMGGGESAVRNILVSLSEETRARIQLVLLRDPRAPEYERALGLPVHDLGALSFLDGVLRLRRWLHRHPTTRVQAHLAQCIIAAGLALVGRPEELLVFIHAFGTWKQRPRLAHRLRIALERWVVLHRATRVIYVSQRVREAHEEKLSYPGRKGQVIPNLLHGQAPVSIPRPGRALRLISVGRIELVKGFDWVLDLPDLPDMLTGVEWTIFGDGAHLPALKEKVARLSLHNIRFAGRCDEVPARLAESDVFFMPSLSEGLSVALLEACRAGLPLLCTDVGSNREVLEDGVNGRLVSVGDGPALAAALAELRDPDLRLRWAEESLRLFYERFSPQHLLPQLEELFQ